MTRPATPRVLPGIFALLAASVAIAADENTAAELFGASSNSAAFALQGDGESDSFLPVEQAFRATLEESETQFVVNWTIAPDYYLYLRQFGLRDSAGRDLTAALAFSRSIQKYDGYFGLVGVYYHSASVTIDKAALQQAGSNGDGLVLRYQGCAEAGLCYPEQDYPLNRLPPTASAADPSPRY